jgi:beta-aspartyl-peptidase (threonine type)
VVVLAVHGGAGGDGPWRGMTDADPLRVACMNSLLKNLGKRLADGSLDALEAVTLAVELMEDEPLFNAGRGSVLDASGSVTMDASIMRGHDRAAGSVVGLRTSRHPVRVAWHLLEGGWPLMLSGAAGDEYGQQQGVEQVSTEWLKTELRKAQWTKWQTQRLVPGATDEEDALLDHDAEQDGWGTVGAVALDRHGHLAAATSTGGMTGKPLGRVGDTPIIGAGTWADDHVAVSCTGVGEAFIRTVAAHNLAVRHRTATLEAAAAEVLAEVEPFGGRGGLIAVNQRGEVVVPFQTMLMYRGVYRDGRVEVGIGPDMMDDSP